MKPAESPNFLKKHKLAAGCIAVAVLFGGATFYRSGATPEREALLEQKSAEGQRLQNNLTNSTLLQEQYNSFVALNERIQERLINPAQLGENLQFFYKIEAATGTKILDLRQNYAGPAKGFKGNFAPVPYSVSIQGELRSVLNFVRRVEKSGRYSKTVSATLLRGAGDQAENAPMTLNLSVELLGKP